MKLVDVNVLVYATDKATKHHVIAKTWLDQAMNSSETIGMPTAVTVAYLRLTTNPKVMTTPLSIFESRDIAETWLRRSNVSVPTPGRQHYHILSELIDHTGVGGNLVSDAHLGALAIEHGATLVSFDSDFSRFPGLNWLNPLTPF